MIAQAALRPIAGRQPAVLALRGCRRVFLRYELFLGAAARPHDHVSIRFLIDPSAATVVPFPERPEPA